MCRIPDARFKDTLSHFRIAIVCGSRPVTIDQAEFLFAYDIRPGLQIFMRAGFGREQCARSRGEYTREAEQTCRGIPGEPHVQSIDGLAVNEKK